MAKSTGHPKSSKGKSKALSNSRATTPMLGRPRKTPLTRQGMSPQRLLDVAGTISVETLDAMEKAIEEGCSQGGDSWRIACCST